MTIQALSRCKVIAPLAAGIRFGRFWIGFICLAFLAGCASVPDKPPSPQDAEIGLASYYADRFHGRRTASGERYDRHDLTAAHRQLPFGTRLRVTRLDNGASVEVRVNDRGPFVAGRVIDLSYAAAKKIGMLRMGVARVRVVRLD